MTRNLPALVFLALVAVALVLWLWLKTDPRREALRVREIATRGLAEHLARTLPGQRALIVSNPFTQQPDIAKAIVEMEQAGVRGLRQGFGAAVAVKAVAFPELSPEARSNPQAALAGVETTTPLSYLVTPEAFDHLARQHADCEIIVSLIGLPVEIQRSEAWQAPAAPRFALLLPDLRIIGDAAAVRDAFNSGKLAAVVLANPAAAEAESPRTRDWKAEFEKRFVLLTADNVEQAARSYPGLF
jgi:hypothetical protein